MKVCDRDRKLVTNTLRNLQDGSEFDFCRDCYQEFLAFTQEQPKQRPADKKGGSK